MDTTLDSLTRMLGSLGNDPELRPKLLKLATFAAGAVIALGVADDRSGRKVRKAAKDFTRSARKSLKSAGKLARSIGRVAQKHPQRAAALLASVAALTKVEQQAEAAGDAGRKAREDRDDSEPAALRH
jgi:hypothetical protein